MASILNRVLTLKRDREKHTVRAIVKCDIRFTDLELCQMKSCQVRHYKLRCELWGKELGLAEQIFFGSDDYLFTYSDIYFFPDGTPTLTESRSFDVTIGDSLLDEDLGRDEIYGKLKLYNLGTGALLARETNIVTGWF
jgi:hypothetical protein